MKGNKIVIIILVVLLLCACGYIAYDKLIVGDNVTTKESSDSKKVNDNNTKNEEILEVVDSQVASLTNNIRIYTCDGYSLNLFTDKKVTPNDYDNRLAFEVTAWKLINEQNVGYEYSKIKEVSQEDFVRAVKSLLGKDYNYTDFDKDVCNPYKYDANTKSYKYHETACGCTTGPTDDINIVKAVKTDNTIEVYFRVLFVDNSNGDNIKYYSDYTKSNLIIDNALSSNEYTFGLPETKAKGALYKQVFTLEDGNYVFTSSELVK